jgi:hypothetical protein
MAYQLNPATAPKSVKTARSGVKKPSRPTSACLFTTYRRHMSVLIFVVLTVAIFALLGLVQKLVERL